MRTRPLLAATVTLLSVPLLANGGTVRIADAPVGEYRVSVYTAPDPPRTDSLDVSVLVLGRDGTPARHEVDVRVTAHWRRPEAAAEPPDTTQARTVFSPATRAAADDPRYYAAKIVPGRAGDWTVEVELDGPDGRGRLSFDLELGPPGLLDRTWVVFLVSLLPLLVLTWWLARSGEPER